MPITDSNLEGMFTFETGATPSAEEPPFHMLFMGNWSGDGAKPGLDSRRPVMIDRDNFDSVMERFGVALELDLGGGAISLRFNEIDDFGPDNLFRNLPIFAELRDVRKRLRSVDSFDEAASEVRSWFKSEEKEAEAPVEPVAEAPKYSLDDILSGTQARHAEETDLSRLISKVVEPYLVKVDETEQSKLVAGVDSTISNLMRSILHHPSFRSLESAWRGLFFAVRRIETDVDLKLFVLNLSKDELSDNLKGVNSLAETVLYREVIRERLEMPGADPFSLICADYSFGANVDDAATLMRIGRIARAADASFVSHMRPEMFGLASFARLPEPSAFSIREETNEGKLWSAVRAVPEAGFLGLCPMRFLARVPYGADSDPAESFEFEEFTDAVPHEDFVWANPSFICAVLLAQSYRAYGWDMGDALMRDLDRLPIYHYVDDGEKKMKPCAESLMTEAISEKLLENGLMPLISFKDSDRVRIASYRSAASPAASLGGRWNK